MRTHTETTVTPTITIRADVLLMEVIRNHPQADRAAHARLFRQELLADDGAEFLDALIAEYVSIKYSTALAHAFPPVRSVKQQVAEQRKAAEKTAETIKAREVRVAAKVASIGERIWNLVMPNDKPLHECTGTEVVGFGKQFVKIGELAGNRKIGEALSPAKITAHLTGRK